MKRILLVGKLNKVMQEQLDFLSETFRVQMCPEILSVVKTMKELQNPDLIVLNQIGLMKEDVEIMDYLSHTDTKIPVVVVTTQERESKVEILRQAGNDVYTLKYPAIPNVLKNICIDFSQTEAEFWGEVEQEEEPVVPTEKTIMIVDDNPVALRSMKKLLEEDYDVMIATSGSQALNFIYKKKPDLVLLDYEMPDMNGLELFERLKQNQITKDLPVIFLTGISDKEHVMKIIQSEPRGYMLKPPVKELLLNKVAEVLG